ncbi:hypothetical protein FACS1894190_11030 [Spirochaetia bacterium]|nr:hypothetical protein FACS1894190_11030 [Spirochaetia bacterium]
MVSYFDSSVLMTIILHEPRMKEAESLWKLSSNKASSILLRIESLVSLRRFYEHNKHRLETNWLALKTSELNNFLREVTCLIIDKTIENITLQNKNLAKCRTLDAIHLATALDIKNNSNNAYDMKLYTFDVNMYDLAKDFDFITNIL